MKIKLKKGTIVFKGREFLPSNDILDFDRSIINSLLKSPICEIEMVTEDAVVKDLKTQNASSSPVVLPGAKEITIDSKDAESEDENSPNVGTVDWLREQLSDRGVEFDWSDKKSVLVDLYEMQIGPMPK